MEKLKKELDKYDEAYYNKSISLVSDAVYDELKRQYVKGTNKDLDYVGIKPAASEVHVTHLQPLKSLSNTFDDKGVEAFMQRCDKRADTKLTYVVEPKIDGLSAVLRYNEGILVSVATRGDGTTGGDVTESFKAKVIDAPVELPITALEFELIVEVYVSDASFEDLPKYTTQRSAASGILRTSADLGQVLDYKVHGWTGLESEEFPSYERTKESLREMGLNVIETIEVFKTKQFDNALLETAPSIGIPLDGLVIKVDDLVTRELLGSTGHSPVWATAFKFPTNTAVTTLKQIIWQVGRSGILTPVGIYEPVQLGGVTNTRATLHNFDEIERLDLRVKDTIEIERGGEIIPKILRVISHVADEPTKPPTECPECGSAVDQIVGQDTATQLKCSAGEACKGVLTNAITYFASRPCMYIVGLGKATIRSLVESGDLTSVADIYRLTEEQLTGANGGKILYWIKLSKGNTLDKFIAGLGIPGVGAGSAKKLALEAGDVETLMDMEVCKDHKGLIQELLDLGLKPKSVPKWDMMVSVGSKKNLTVVITGTFDKPRKELIAEITMKGYDVGNTVSGKTGYLLVGDKPSSKLAKAKKLNVPCITTTEELPA